MDAPYSPHERAERLIVAGRFLLAAFSLLAVCLDPTEPSRFASAVRTILAFYLAHAFLLAALKEAGHGPLPLRQRVTPLKGSLILDSGDAGTRLEISLPLAHGGS